MKKHHSANLLTLIAFLILFSCKEVKEEKIEIIKTPVANLDSMNKVWQNGWNTQNIETLKNLIADKAVVFMYNWKLEGKDSIMKNWINVSAPYLRNLTIENFKNESAAEMAFSSGYYTYKVVSNDSVKAVDKGAYSIIWKLQADRSWKMELLQFSAPK